MLGKLARLSRSVCASQARPADRWALSFLTPAEASVYSQMDPRDREHACRVARQLQAAIPSASAELLAAALLHDCGKAVRPYSVVERVLVGLVPQRLAHRLAVGPLAVRAFHPQLGAHLLLAAGARHQVAVWVAQHHQPQASAEAKILHHYDDLE